MWVFLSVYIRNSHNQILLYILNNKRSIGHPYLPFLVIFSLPDLQPISQKEKEGTLSFSEVMEKVERGEKLPGVEELNIEATNSEITESQCQRVKKPWEN